MINKEYNYFSQSIDEHGEMLPFERQVLYSWIQKYQPNNLLEIGTGTGGSTQYISDAMTENGFGTIFSCDPTRSPSKTFIETRPNLKFYSIISTELIDIIILNNISIDFIFFDGPENPDIALQDLLRLEKYISNDILFCMHDWHTGIRNYDSSRSTKSDKIKPYIENSDQWTNIDTLYANKKNSNFDSTPWDSVGLCLYQFKKL